MVPVLVVLVAVVGLVGNGALRSAPMVFCRAVLDRIAMLALIEASNANTAVESTRERIARAARIPESLALLDADVDRAANEIAAFPWMLF